MIPSILAVTVGGLIDRDLAAGGHSVQPPDPLETKSVVAVAGDAGYADAQKHGVAIVGAAGKANVNGLGLAYAGAEGCARGGAAYLRLPSPGSMLGVPRPQNYPQHKSRP